MLVAITDLLVVTIDDTIKGSYLEGGFFTSGGFSTRSGLSSQR
jgi:hypothetical protein